MASLIFAAGFLTYNKVKDKREAKKEKKRKGYEERYTELEREHTQDQEKFITKQKTGDKPSGNPFEDNVAVPKERRTSTDSQGSRHSNDGDPSQWVEEVVRQRSKSDAGRVS